MKTRIFVAFLLLTVTGTTYSQEPDNDTLLKRLVGTDDDNFGETRSEEVLKELKSGRTFEPKPLPPKPSVATKKTFRPILVKLSEAESKDLSDTMARYLEFHKDTFDLPGVDLLEPKHLDPRLLDYRFDKDKNGERTLRITPGERFRQHVAVRGRKHLLKQRLRITAFVAGTVAAVLFFLYGALKLLNARSTDRDDYISTSQVPMV